MAYLTRKKSIICHSGVIISNDGDERIIHAQRLPDLYNVDRSLCIYVDKLDDLRGLRPEDLDSWIHLFPRSSGDYNKLPLIGEIEKEQ